MSLESFVSAANSIVWSPALIALCLGAGIFFSIATRFVQVRMIGEMLRCMFGGKGSDQGISPFQAFALAVSGRVGTGNIAGVATAIALGGPGAVFWMWLIAFVGSGSAFVEATLAQIYKQKIDGQYRGGPAYYIEQGMRTKWYAIVFAVATIIGCGLCLPTVQSNSIGSAMENAFGLPTWASGLIVAGGIAAIVLGGVKRIGFAVQMIVPFMAVGYMLA